MTSIYDEETGIYNSELTQGEWLLNYTIEGDKQLWQRITIGAEDISGADYEFVESQTVSGVISDGSGKDNPESPPGLPVSYQEVLFQWDGFSITSIIKMETLALTCLLGPG